MASNIHIGYISDNNELTLLWSNNEIQQIGFPEYSCAHNINLVDDKLTKIIPILGMLKFIRDGKSIKILLISPSGTRTVFRKFTVDNHNNIKEIVNKPSLTECVVNFLVENCPEFQKVLDISNFCVDIFNNVSEIDKVVSETEKSSIKNNKKSVIKTSIQNKAENIQKMARFMGRNFPTKGDIQSIKTKFIISTATWFILNGKSVLIVLRNCTDDSDQIQSRIQCFVNALKDSLESHGFDRNMFNIECVSKNKITKEIIRGDKPKIMIALYNKYQLQNFYDLLTEEEKQKYVVFVDEADMLHKTVTGKEKTAKNEIPASVYLDKIIKNAFCSFSVSGTILDAILKSNIKAEDLIVLKSPVGYKSHNTFLINHLELPCKFTSSISESIIDNDPNILPFLCKINIQKPFSSFYNEKHPVYTLMRVADVIKPMENLFNTVINDFPNIVFMLYNGSGMKVHHVSIRDIKNIKLSNNRVSKNETGIHFFDKGSNPTFILEWLKNNGGVKRFPNIVTIAGDLATRGISYGAADYANCVKNNKLGWHLTDMYATFAKNTDIPEILQTTGRLCITSHDNIPLTLHTPEKDHLNLIRGFNLIAEFVARSKAQLPKTELNEYLKNTDIYRKKVPVGRSLTKTESFKIKKTTEKEDIQAEGWLTDKAGNYILKSVSVKLEDGQVYEDISQVTKDGVVFGEEETVIDTYTINKDDKQSEETSRLEKVRKSYNSDNPTVVKRIINKFIEEEFREIDSKKLKTDCDFKQLTNYTRWGGNNCYKIIERTVSGYKLRTEIIEYLNL